MPIYVYETKSGQRFEVMQRMADDPLIEHPETGEACRRVITAPQIMGDYSDHKMGQSVKDDKKLDRLGFTKYVKAGNGYYEKRAGKGPDVIHKDAQP